jgi:hypothetical protein
MTAAWVLLLQAVAAGPACCSSLRQHSRRQHRSQGVRAGLIQEQDIVSNMQSTGMPLRLLLLLPSADSLRSCCQSFCAPAATLLSGLLSMYMRTMAWLRLLLSFIRVARVCARQQIMVVSHSHSAGTPTAYQRMASTATTKMAKLRPAGLLA